jgi:hypothetical protein
MYENWQLRRWETPMSDAKDLFMESLHDHAGVLEIDFAGYSDNTVVARYRVTFRNYPAYRNIDEMYRLELWEKRRQHTEPNAAGWTLSVPESPWIQEFVGEPILGLFNPGLVHYFIVTHNDVIEILANEEPIIDRMY